MNSDAILRELNRLVNDRTLNTRQRSIVEQAVQHIRLQDDENHGLKDDITDMNIPQSGENHDTKR
jgi:hypothetical protein